LYRLQQRQFWNFGFGLRRLFEQGSDERFFGLAPGSFEMERFGRLRRSGYGGGL
jgi:hypothetical protein